MAISANGTSPPWSRLGRPSTPHVQTCFDHEAALAGQILNGEEPNIEAGWPGGGLDARLRAGRVAAHCLAGSGDQQLQPHRRSRLFHSNRPDSRSKPHQKPCGLSGAPSPLPARDDASEPLKVTAGGELHPTGQAAALRRGYGVTAAYGAFTLTGQAAAFQSTYRVTATYRGLHPYRASGGLQARPEGRGGLRAFTLSGQAASLNQGRKVTAAYGAFHPDRAGGDVRPHQGNRGGLRLLHPDRSGRQFAAWLRLLAGIRRFHADGHCGCASSLAPRQVVRRLRHLLPANRPHELRPTSARRAPLKPPSPAKPRKSKGHKPARTVRSIIQAAQRKFEALVSGDNTSADEMTDGLEAYNGLVRAIQGIGSRLSNQPALTVSATAEVAASIAARPRPSPSLCPANPRHGARFGVADVNADFSIPQLHHRQERRAPRRCGGEPDALHQRRRPRVVF